MQRKKRITIEIRNTTVNILIDISIKRRHIEIALALFSCILAIFVSSFNEDVHRTWTDFLYWILRILIFGEGH